MSQREELEPLLYTPWQQEGEVIGDMHFALRTTGEPAASPPRYARLCANWTAICRSRKSVHKVPARRRLWGKNACRPAPEFLRHFGALARSHRAGGRVGLFDLPTHE